MIEVLPNADFRIIKSFETTNRAQEGFEIAGRRILSGPLLTKETLKMKRVSGQDPEMQEIINSELPLEQMAMQLMSTDAGWRFITALCNMRLIAGDTLIADDLIDVLETPEKVFDFIVVLTQAKTLEQVLEEQKALELAQDDEQEQSGVDSPNALSPLGDTSEDSSTGILTPALFLPV